MEKNLLVRRKGGHSSRGDSRWSFVELIESPRAIADGCEAHRSVKKVTMQVEKVAYFDSGDLGPLFR